MNHFLGFTDWIFVTLYLLVIAGVSVWSIRKTKNTTSDYFLANRNLGWFVIGASILASNVGSEHIVGLAGSAANSGTVLGHYELHSWIVLILGWVFVPFYLRSAVYTMPEFLERRFNPQSRRLLSIIQLFSYVIAKASVTIFAGALVFNQFLGVDFWTGAIILVVVTGIYTVLGGLHAVMYTEAIQAIVLLCGSAFLLFFGLREVGGWHSLMNSIPTEKLIPGWAYFSHRPSWGSGTGAPTSISCNDALLQKMKKKQGAEPSSLLFLNCFHFLFSWYLV